MTTGFKMFKKFKKFKMFKMFKKFKRWLDGEHARRDRRAGDRRDVVVQDRDDERSIATELIWEVPAGQ